MIYDGASKGLWSVYRSELLLLLHCWEVRGFWDSEGLCVSLVPRSKGWRQTSYPPRPPGGATGLKRCNTAGSLYLYLTCPLSVKHTPSLLRVITHTHTTPHSLYTQT